jgi:hypothetical protein
MIRIDYCGVGGAGKAVKAAKLDAGRKIETMLKGDYLPEVIVFRGFVALLWREPYGWFSKLLTDSTHEIQTGRLNGCASHTAQEKCREEREVRVASSDVSHNWWTRCLTYATPILATAAHLVQPQNMLTNLAQRMSPEMLVFGCFVKSIF